MAVQIFGVPVSKIEILPQRFERKYFLHLKDVDLAYGLLRQICRLDSQYPSEQINSLYFDTPDLDQHERSASGDYFKDKIRLRWYGDDAQLSGTQTLFLELKSRRGFASTKQRLKLAIPAAELVPDRLKRGIIPSTLLMDTLMGFGYFPSNIIVPVIKISYWRYRFCEIMTGQRLSLDCQIHSRMILPGAGHYKNELALPGGVIEIKGESMELPVALRKARMLDTDWTRFSKYSACIDAHCETPGSIGCTSPSGRIVRF